MSLDLCLLVGTKENLGSSGTFCRDLVGNREVPPLKCGWGQQLQGASSSKRGQGWAGLPCPTEEPGFWPAVVCWSRNWFTRAEA